MKRKRFIQICSIAMLLFLFNTGMALSAELEINNQEGSPGKQVIFNISINNTPEELNSMEFNITYDSKILNFEGWEAAELVSDFAFFNAAKVNGNSAVIKVAGLTRDPILASTSGEIVQLTFSINECQETKLSLTDLQGAIKGFSTRAGILRCK